MFFKILSTVKTFIETATIYFWKLVSDVVGFSGEILWDFTKPNGTPRKVLNVDKIKSLGWKPKISLREGIKSTYQWYLKNYGK